MKAVIMAGGEGTRLRPLTSRQPKPMLPIANRPMMEHVIELLKAHGISEIIVTVAFLANSIRNYFGDGSEFGVKMVYATESTPLGTAGSVRNAMEQLDDTFLVISGDVLTDIDLTKVIDTHKSSKAIATIALKEMENPLEFGIVIQKPDGSIERFLEKPTWGQVFSDTVNTGICILEREIFDYIPENEESDFSGDIFPELLRKRRLIQGHVAEGYWEDVGTLEAYLRAHYDVLDRKVHVDIRGFELGNSVWLGEGAEVHPDAVIEGPVVIGPYSTVDAGAHLDEYTVLGSNVRVGPSVVLRRSVVHDNSYLGAQSRLRETVIGRSTDLRRGVRCESGVVIGDETFIGEEALITAGVKIYPNKEVERGAVVNSSIVWESRASRHLFTGVGIAGLANVDITPELAVRAAMAFGSTLKKGTTVALSRDSSRAARTISRAFASGLNATGVSILDMEVSPIPVTRFLVRTGRSNAGITVRLHADDPESVVIRFFDNNGYDLDESAQRKIERIYYREDFRRVAASEIGDIGFPPRIVEYYTAALIDKSPIDAIREAQFKVVLDYSYGSTSFVMPNVLSKLNAEVLTVNPFGSTRGVLRFDIEEHAARVAALVQASGAHLGAVFDPDGERINFIDDTGHVLSNENARLAVLALTGRTINQLQNSDARSIALPVSAPIAAEDVAAHYGLEIVQTKLSAYDLMTQASKHQVIFGAGSDGDYIFPRFIPAFDAVSSFVNVLGMLALTGVRISELMTELPRVHMSHEVVETPWEQKGHVMRILIESIRGKEVELVDGLKIRDGRTWVLILPDTERPLTHIWAEAGSARDARGISQQYVRQIRQTLRRLSN